MKVTKAGHTPQRKCSYSVMSGHNRPTVSKAREMLRHGSVGGRKLTAAQRGYFGAVVGGVAREY